MIALFTTYELERLTDDELDELFSILNRLLVQTKAGTADRRNILASLENITLVRNRRSAAPALSR